MSRPFEDAEARYLVLANAEAQYSLWPVFAEVPAGWQIVHPADARTGSLAYIEEHWTGGRPAVPAAATRGDDR